MTAALLARAQSLADRVFAFPASAARAAALTALVTVLVTYGGIRSPDSEVIFRTAERLAFAGTFAHDRDLEGWKDFGLPKGVDGLRYQWFGPGQSLYEAPFVPLATAWGAALAEHFPSLDPPPSHYFQRGLDQAYSGLPVPRPHLAGHLTRSVLSLLDALTLALTVLVLHRIFEAALGSRARAGWAALATALATPLLNYATTLFGEPLATLGCSLALLQVVRGDPDLRSTERPTDLRLRRMILAGGLVSAAATAHLTAILYAPLLGIYAWRNAARKVGRWWSTALVPPFVMTLASLPLVLWMGQQNYAHFGDPFETGRGVMPRFWVRDFVAPWEGLYGQTISPGKGLLWIAPLACFSVAFALYHRRHLPWIAKALLVYLGCRVLFLAGRDDWHAGFCLGPRYMMMALPDFLLVGALAWKTWTSARRPTRATAGWIAALTTAAIGLAIVQQLYFASGEIFLFTHRMRNLAAAEHRAGLEADIYFDWKYTPIRGLLDWTSGPWLYRALHLDPYAGWASWSVATAALATLAGLGAARGHRSAEGKGDP